MNDYELLDIQSGATEKEIKAAYIKKAKEWHPDVNNSPEAPEKFKEINGAYERLTKSKPDISFGYNTTEDVWQNILRKSGFYGFGAMPFTRPNNRTKTTITVTIECKDDSEPSKIVEFLLKNDYKIIRQSTEAK